MSFGDNFKNLPQDLAQLNSYSSEGVLKKHNAKVMENYFLHTTTKPRKFLDLNECAVAFI